MSFYLQSKFTESEMKETFLNRKSSKWALIQIEMAKELTTGEIRVLKLISGNISWLLLKLT